MYFAKMKFLTVISILILSICMASCGQKKDNANQLTHEDSLKIINDRAFQIRLAELQKVRDTLTGPAIVGQIDVSKGDKFKTNILDDSTAVITGDFEKLNSKLERAQKDSTTMYGGLLTRFRLLKTQHKYLTGTYTEDAHLLRFTSEITIDDRHEDDRDFYFDNFTLVYFRERHTYTKDEQDLMNDDSYFLRDGKVVYAYRDEGTAPERKDRMNVMSMKRYLLKGDLTAHVSKEFDNFRADYNILLDQPLEPLIYPGEGRAQQ